MGRCSPAVLPPEVRPPAPPTACQFHLIIEHHCTGRRMKLTQCTSGRRGEREGGEPGCGGNGMLPAEGGKRQGGVHYFWHSRSSRLRKACSRRAGSSARTAACAFDLCSASPLLVSTFSSCSPSSRSSAAACGILQTNTGSQQWSACRKQRHHPPRGRGNERQTL